jgi:hypothetical protein
MAPAVDGGAAETVTVIESTIETEIESEVKAKAVETAIESEVKAALEVGEAAGRKKRAAKLSASISTARAGPSSAARTTGLVTSLAEGEVFVFGSNEAGRHGKGAAKLARQWGAKAGQAEGMQGSTYALPTKNAAVSRSLGLSQIGRYVAGFVEYAEQNPQVSSKHHLPAYRNLNPNPSPNPNPNPQLTFLVTEIGCGLADFSPREIAPLFAAARKLENVHLPAAFWKELGCT